MKSFLRTLLAVLLGELILLAVAVGWVATKLQDDVDVERGSVLVQTIDGIIPDTNPPGGMPMPGAETGPTHMSILENLEKARHDERIQAVVLKLGSPAIGFGSMTELRERIHQLQAAGKPVWGHVTWLSRGNLYLGAACDSLFLLPQGYVGLRGFAAGRYFVARALEKLDVEPNTHRIGAYKAMDELVNRASMSEESRENTNWLLDEIYPHYIETVEGDLGLAPGTLAGQVWEAGMLTPAEALEIGLVDRLAYWDEMLTAALELSGVEQDEDSEDGLALRPHVISGGDYAKVSRRDAGIDADHTIAVVGAMGLIAGEQSGVQFPLGETMGAETIAQAFADAVANDDVDAILYRVDSGGGESSVSWRIQRAALLAAEKKPIVVSMADVAGSGGYIICYPLKPLIANERCIVGSIGSISGKFNLHGLYDKLGITWDFVTRGPNALMESDYYNYTDEQWASFKQRHWQDYYDWIEDVALHRGKTPAEIDSVGRGRVFTGTQAVAIGLIDQVGTFDDAVAALKAKAEIPADAEVDFVYYPEKKGFLEMLTSGDFATAVQILARDLAARTLDPFRHEQTWAVTPQAGVHVD